MIYVLAYPIFGAAITKAIDQFRADNEPERAKLVRPHVSLVFGLKDIEPIKFTGDCEKILEGRQTLPVSFHEFGISYDSTEKTHKMVLVCSEGKRELTALNQRLYEGIQNSQYREDISYIPHMTIATNPDRSVLEHLNPSLFGDWPLEAIIREIGIVEVVAGQLKTLKSVALGR